MPILAIAVIYLVATIVALFYFVPPLVAAYILCTAGLIMALIIPVK
jgi:hypothetical protein